MSTERTAGPVPEARSNAMPETSNESGWDFPADLNEAAWGLIANAWEGDWSQAPPAWVEAAERWRDAYHETLIADDLPDRRPHHRSRES